MNGKVAIIGGGVAGLTAAYLLNDKYDITLFEKDNRLGGNAHTITTSDGLNFDIAVAVFGKNSYPNFRKLLRKINVKINRFSSGGVAWQNLDTRECEYFAWKLKGLIKQRFATFNPRKLFPYFKSILSMSRGKKYLKEGKFEGLTMEEALKMLPPFKGGSLKLHMFAMCLVSSMYYEEIMKAPATFFFGKMVVHRDFFENPVFSLFQVTGNTKSYIEALASYFTDKVVLNSKIRGIARSQNEVIIKMEDGSRAPFNKVVFACNADQILDLLEMPTDNERRLLGSWQYKDGPIVVHKDRSSFPEKELYNLFTFLYTDRDGKVHTSVNGHIRSLKSVPDDCKYISSQHPNFPIKKELIEFSKVFRTPIFTDKSVPKIKELPKLNGVLNSYYCGSHFGYGLHEDGVNSAIEVARLLGVDWV